MSRNYLFTSESVSEGHPDKICDQVSDAVLDAVLKDDPASRVACECFSSTGMLLVGGEITTNTYVDIQQLTRDVIREIGYTSGEYRFDADSCAVMNVINQQSADIAMGVDTGGAGDQGIMFGYANRETEVLMPAPIMYSHRLVEELAKIRKEGKIMNYLRPDSKSQVTLEYDADGNIVRCDAIVVSTQHDPGITQETIKTDIIDNLVPLVLPKNLIDENTKFHINPTGKFEIGGPHGDAGLTGRKIIVDTYGGRAPHGGGAFSGKDSTKVDRSVAYASRHLAKNLVAAGVSDELTIQLSYAIGVAQPVSINVDTHGTGKTDSRAIEDYIMKNIDLTPKGIIDRLDLRKPVFAKTAAYGHFGREEFSWENLELKSEFEKNLV